MQPLINYAIRAVFELNDPVDGAVKEVQDTRNISLIPVIGPSPPLATEDFPGEFVLKSTKLLAKIPYANPFGAMTISMNEPSALVFNSDSQNATTLGFLKLTLKPSNSVGSSAAPRVLKCTIWSQIHVKTFFSTMPLCGMPNYSMLERKSGLRIESRYIDLQTRKISARSWIPEEQSLPGATPEAGDSLWTTTLVLPICGSSRLLPTFCSTLAALRYALKVRVNIRGFHHFPLGLEIPLQVLYSNDVRNAQASSIVDNNHGGQNVQDAAGSQVSSIFDIFLVRFSFSHCILFLLSSSIAF